MSQRRFARVPLLVATAIALALAAPAAAGGPDDPELVDGCGPELPTTRSVDAPTSWTDICAGWYTTLTGETGPPAIAVTLSFAGDLADPPEPASYFFRFYRDDCVFTVRRDGSGNGTFGSRCGPSSRPAPCHPSVPAVGCSETIPLAYVPLPGEVFSVDGNTLTTTLVFAGGLEHVAGHFGAGEVLESLWASAQVDHRYRVTGTACAVGTCVTAFGDHARDGADYVIEAGTGPAVEGPIVPQGPPFACLEGPLAEGSRDRPHVVDAPNDHGRSVFHLPAGDAPAFDLRALWFAAADDAVTVNVLPAGPEHVTGELSYQVNFNGLRIWAMEDPDGTWRATLTPDADGVEGATAEEQALEVSVDAGSGLVTVTVPEEALPAGDLLFDRFMSFYPYGGRVLPSDPGRVSVSSDSERGATVCAALR